MLVKYVNASPKSLKLCIKRPFTYFLVYSRQLLFVTKAIIKVSKGAKIRNRYNQVHHLTQDSNGKVTNSHKDTTNESQEVSSFPAGDHKAQ